MVGIETFLDNLLALGGNIKVSEKADKLKEILLRLEGKGTKILGSEKIRLKRRELEEYHKRAVTYK